MCAEVIGVRPRTRYVGGGPTGRDLDTFDNHDCVFPFSNENTVGALDAAREAGLLAPYKPFPDMIESAYAFLRGHPERRHWQRTNAEQDVLTRLDRAGSA